jgi:Flp pilus assembly protein TadG
VVARGPLRFFPASRAQARERETGAVAVEFALLLPILMLFLFGIIQYGYGLFQLQAFNSTMQDVSRLAATGITSCTSITDTLHSLADDDGLDNTQVTAPVVSFLDSAGHQVDQAQPLGLVRVTASYTPFRIGFPGIPFPHTVTRSQTVPIQDVGLASLTGCPAS